MTIGGGIGERARIRIEPQPAPGERDDLRRRLRLKHRDVFWIKAEPKPAFEQSAAHLAGADQDEQAGKIAQIRTWPGRRSRLARGLEHGGIHRFARGLAGPDHELKCREVTLAGIERGAEHRLALPVRRGDPAGKNQRMAEHDDAVLRPDVEMSDP